MIQPAADSLVLPLDSAFASLENAGGKGANLARMAQAGLPVPGGFFVTVSAYECYVNSLGLNQKILAALSAVPLDSLAELEKISAAIRAWFDPAQIPASVSEAILDAYRPSRNSPVAVRSSATAEDLPGFSFAGQQDTYLNIVGEEVLLTAVAQCWSSLWTARAIGYRARNGISQNQISLAVVVQQMVPSEVSGVLFTANPLTGLRSETVIDATFGLGEALVSGQVEPDHYVVNRLQKQVTSQSVGTKAVVIQGKAAGGVERVEQTGTTKPALSDNQILALAELGEQVEQLYGFPQDIEWALSDGNLHLLQSRPITTLYPIVKEYPAHPVEAFFSFGAVQGLLDPITPLGQDMLRVAFSGFARMAGIRANYQTQTVLYESGERLWGRITPVLRNSIGRRVIPGIMQSVDPAVGQLLVPLLSGHDFLPERPGIRPATVRKILTLVLPVARNVALNLASPDRRRKWLFDFAEQHLARLQARITHLEEGEAALVELTKMLYQIADLFKIMFPPFISSIASGMMSLNLLNQLSKNLPGGQTGGFTKITLAVTRGMPYNVTTEMDLKLWETAKKIKSSPETVQIIQSTEPKDLAAAYRAGTLPPPAQSAIQSFMDRYGARGIGEIDMGRARWREDSTPLMQVLRSYLDIDENQSPSAVFGRSRQSAEQAINELIQQLKQTRGGWFKSRLARWAARRVRGLLGLREFPKFTIIRLTGTIRDGLLQVGEYFVHKNILDRPDDLFFLSLEQLEILADPMKQKTEDWRKLVQEKRTAYGREKMRRQVPRLLLSDGRTFYEGLTSGDGSKNRMAGSPVSVGMVEGRVHVVLDPTGTRLEPGEILVCPGTDPAWTPLFLSAGGLIMEVGGMMTHGAVVAREYGIPAVVGVHEATLALKTGQRIRLDGSSGIIEILNDPPGS